jgi:sugar/nucleoside kinase (ribokinase family)
MYDVITVGSAVVDVFVDTGMHERKGFIAYPVGCKFVVRDLKFYTGGGGTNTAVSFSNLGLKTAFLGKIGTGTNSLLILKELKKYKVDFIGKTSEKYHTGFSIILDSKEHNRTVLTYKGANNHLKFSEINKNKLKTKWFYFSSMLEESFKTQVKLAKFAEKHKIKIAYNPSSYQAVRGAKYLKDILKRTTMLILNREEASYLTKEENLLEGLYKLGPKIICITDGKNGSYAYDGKSTYIVKPHKIKVKERTGAGDAFASAFVAAYIKKNNVEFALQAGSANAESTIQKPGAKNGLLTWNQLMKSIKEKPFKIKIQKFN